jgi:hypothetical protein
MLPAHVPFILLALVALFGSAIEAAAQVQHAELAYLGVVERTQGEVTLLRGSKAKLATAGEQVTRGDTVSTAVDSRVALRFQDGTRLTLGERAEALIDYFVYNPIKKSGAAFIDVVKGAFRFTAGEMRDLNDKRIEVRTDQATLAADGSDFWGGRIDDVFEVLLINGRIEVRNDAGKVILQKKRMGSSVATSRTPPDVPTAWGKDKVGQAFATVAFK